MGNSRKSMIVYYDEVNLLSSLKGDDYKTIFEAVIRYWRTRELTKMPENLEYMYRAMVAHAERDMSKYELIVEARRKAGQKSVLARANKASCPKGASSNEKSEKTRVGKKTAEIGKDCLSETSVIEENKLSNEGQGEAIVKKELLRAIPPETPSVDLIFEDTEANRLNEPWKIPYGSFRNDAKSTDKPDVDTSTDKPESVTSTDKPDVDTSTDKPESVTSTDKSESVTSTDKSEADISTVTLEADTSTDESEADISTVTPEADTSTDKPDVGISNTYSEPTKTDFCLAYAANAELHPITREGIEYLKTAMRENGVTIPEHLIKEWEEGIED